MPTCVVAYADCGGDYFWGNMNLNDTLSAKLLHEYEVWFNCYLDTYISEKYDDISIELNIGWYYLGLWKYQEEMVSFHKPCRQVCKLIYEFSCQVY